MKQYKIIITGFGGEITIGTVDAATKELLKKAEENLPDAVQTELSDWRNYDDLYHTLGPGEEYVIQIMDENEKKVFEIESENINQFDSDDFTLINYECVEIDNTQDLLMCVSFQKGVLFESIIEDEKFDIKKLQIKVDGEVGINTFTWGDMLSTISYDGIELDNTGTYTEEEDFQVYTNFKAYF
jgi:hypothetical protein